MAVYKVIQDIESEDKLLGPLTLKGFIYAMIAAVCAFINFKLLLTTGLGPTRWVIMLIFLGPMFLFGVLASPLGREQPTEVWLLSRIRFLIQPRKKVWDQSGISDLVTITVPKKPELRLTKDFSQQEVHSRLDVLARTLDSHGWAVKNADLNLISDSPMLNASDGSDRLIDSNSLSSNAPVLDVHAADDILDEQNNPTAQNFESLMQQAEVKRKQSLLAKLKTISTDEPAQPATGLSISPTRSLGDQVMAKTEKDAELDTRLEMARQAFVAQHSKAPATTQPAVAEPPKTNATPPVTVADQAAKLRLAQSGSAFSVATIAQLANRQVDEVVINLH